MNTVDDSPEYYRLRESQERDAAELAANDDTRQIHLVLADKYRQLAKDAEAQPRYD